MSTFQSTGYDIERASNRCAATGRELKPGDPFVTALIDDGQNLLRADYCLDAWQDGNRPDRLFSFWHSVVPQPDARRKLFVDDEVLMNLLHRLEDADQPDRIAFRFVLMLILMRKKLLRYDRTEKRPVDHPAHDPTEQAEWWILTPKLDLAKGPLGKWNQSQSIAVLDPRLDDERIRQVTEQLGQILHAEL
jgi:hypothetical protein